MPEEFDPAWEYRVDDPEIEYCVYSRHPKGYDGFGVNWAKAVRNGWNTGVRFGRGNPDVFNPRVGPTPADRNRASTARPLASQAVRCRGCLGLFKPGKGGRWFCSPRCRAGGGKRGEVLSLVTGPDRITGKEAAARLGVNYKTLASALHRAGVRFPKPVRVFMCPSCGVEFRRPGRKRTYCSPRCARFGQHHMKGKTRDP